MPLAPVHIVIVEDNKINAKLLEYQLRHLAYDVITVFNEAEPALRWLEQNHCDLLLTDCQMHPMDGFELTAQVRALDEQRNKRTRIIAVTAGAMPQDLQACIDAGMDDYLVKPIQLSALQQMLHKWLQ